MKSYIVVSLIAVSLAGCAGLEITPISPDADRKAHEGDPTRSGYIIYAPMAIVEVITKTHCERDKEQKCTSTPITTCMVGTPFVLPDLAKPFLINSKPGFGKSSVDVTISNGWQLGSFKDMSDNTALLTLIEKLGTKILGVPSDGSDLGRCKAPGLYRVNIKGAVVELEKLHLY